MNNKTISKQLSVHAILKKEIMDLRWKVGEYLPTETQLAKRFDCSTGTISKAVSLLVHEGFVERKTRMGTRVVKGSEEDSEDSLNALAFIYPSDKHEGIWRMVAGFQEAAYETKCRTLTLFTGNDYRKEAEFLSRLSEFGVRGAVIHPVIRTPKDLVDFSSILVNSKFSIVLADVNLHGLGCPTILSDGMHEGYTVTKYLLEQGLRRIGFLGNQALNLSIRDKYLGFRQAMEEAGLGESSENVLLDPIMTPRFDDALREPTEIARDYLKKHDDLEGVVCINDFIAHGVLIAAKELGIHVPKQMKVIGIGDYRLLPEQHPPLTTYRVPYEEIGREAFRTLSGKVEKNETGKTEKMIRGELVIRESA